MALWVLAFLAFLPKIDEIDPCLPKDSSVQSIIESKACYYNISPELFLRIAKCESGLKPDVRNPASTASGLFQFLNSTFFNYAKAYELPIDNKNDPEVQAELAARVIANGGLHNWDASRSCWFRPG